ncbi:MAG: ATP-binding cassette domain-containing protein, partial [Eggerthellaceae bacterium]|nr:ATP-binding cassette domain-containing protein [Eggerthellaceae bacterium]
MDKAVVSLQHAKKSFGSNEVLKDISLTVNRGDVLAIIGPSGGGKSTLLRCLTLLETLDYGELDYGDLNVCHMNENQVCIYAKKDVLKEAKSRFGLVFQNFNLFPHYSALKNVTAPLTTVQKVPKDKAAERGRELLAKMGLAGKEDMVPCELSGGQQQRGASARALAMKPDGLYFDEPTSARDPELTQEVLR